MREKAEAALRAKYQTLAEDIPEGFEALAVIDVDALQSEVASLPKKDRLLIARFSDLMAQVEALKHIATEAYSSRMQDMAALREGLFYQDLTPLVLFYEFWMDVDVGTRPNLLVVSSVLEGQRFNKIRNAVAHGDISFAGSVVRFNDRGHVVEMNILKASKLASCLSVLSCLLGIGETG